MTRSTDIIDAEKQQHERTLEILDSDDAAKVAANLSDNIVEWDKLTATDRQNIVAQHMAIINKPRAAETDLVMTDRGHKLAEMEGQSAFRHKIGLVSTFATGSGPFTNNQLSSLITFLKNSYNRPVTADDVNAALAFIAGCTPENEMQSSLALQMFMVQESATRTLGMIGRSDTVEQSAHYGNLGVKLMRTFTMQAEAMAKLQRGGVQTVKHIHIDNRGGQAVVADTVHTGGQNAKLEDQSYEPCTAMSGKDAQRDGLPVAMCEGQETLSNPRRH